MATRAYVLIEARPDRTKDVLESVRKVPGVKMADVVTGPFDVIAMADAADLDALASLISTHIHRIEGVTRTLTCVALPIGDRR